MKQQWKRTMVLATLVAGMSGYSHTTEAASLWGTLAGGILGTVSATAQVTELDNSDEGQQQMLESVQARTGYLHNEAYQQRARNIVEELSKSPHVKRSYTVYVNPDEEFNAFMTFGRVMSINKGAMDLLDDDSLAYVVGHELSHGEHKDLVNGVKKSAALSTALSAATANAGGTATIVANLTGDYLDKQVFTLAQEKKADDLGFEILADSKYNVGGAAVAMAVIKEKYGDTYREGFGQILNPNDHPKTSQRILDNLERLYQYSKGHVKVEKATVHINGKPVYEGTQSGSYTPEMRAYLVAGKLARLYHTDTISGARVDGSTVAIGTTNIVTMPTYDAAFEVAKSMNAAISDESGAGKVKAKKDKKKK